MIDPKEMVEATKQFELKVEAFQKYWENFGYELWSFVREAAEQFKYTPPEYRDDGRSLIGNYKRRVEVYIGDTDCYILFQSYAGEGYYNTEFSLKITEDLTIEGFVSEFVLRSKEYAIEVEHKTEEARLRKIEELQKELERLQND